MRDLLPHHTDHLFLSLLGQLLARPHDGPLSLSLCSLHKAQGQRFGPLDARPFPGSSVAEQAPDGTLDRALHSALAGPQMQQKSI